MGPWLGHLWRFGAKKKKKGFSKYTSLITLNTCNKIYMQFFSTNNFFSPSINYNLKSFEYFSNKNFRIIFVLFFLKIKFFCIFIWVYKVKGLEFLFYDRNYFVKISAIWLFQWQMLSHEKHLWSLCVFCSSLYMYIYIYIPFGCSWNPITYIPTCFRSYKPQESSDSKKNFLSSHLKLKGINAICVWVSMALDSKSVI